MSAYIPETKRFWSKVAILDNGCWQWTGAKGPDGYAVFWMDTKKALAVHAYAYTTTIGPVPKGLELDHLCRNRACLNPLHLEPVTKRENVLRGIGPTAINARKTNCKRGHPLQGNNLILHKDGRRECRQCRRIICLARYHKLKGKNGPKWGKLKELNEL